MTDEEKKQAQDLLDELSEQKVASDNEDWNIRASTFLVFLMWKYPELIMERTGQ